MDMLSQQVTRFRLRNGITATVEEDKKMVEKFLYSHKREDSCSFDVFLKREFKKFI